MKNLSPHLSLRYFFAALLALFISAQSSAQDDINKITVRSKLAGGVVYMLDCENGFGGGNVAASVGPDGILLVDDMYKAMVPKLLAELKKLSDSSIHIVINTHYHGDHIEGNKILSHTSTIIAHDNVLKRLKTNLSPAPEEGLPQITFSEKLTVHFNGEDILLFHLPNGHTDGDVFVYFKTSKVIHMGDTYFNGMFPAVYKEGGGDVLQLIKNFENVHLDIPGDVKVIPGHGDLATKADLVNYIIMLKETTNIVNTAIKAGKPLKQMHEENVLNKYSKLGDGGAQTTDQYLDMLYKLLSQ